MDKTKVGIGFVIGSLVLYAFYRNYATAQQSGKNDQLPAQSEMAYYQTPPVASASDGIGDVYVNHHQVAQTITKQTGKQVLYHGQPLTYPMT